VISAFTTGLRAANVSPGWCAILKPESSASAAWFSSHPVAILLGAPFGGKCPVLTVQARINCTDRTRNGTGVFGNTSVTIVANFGASQIRFHIDPVATSRLIFGVEPGPCSAVKAAVLGTRSSVFTNVAGSITATRSLYSSGRSRQQPAEAQKDFAEWRAISSAGVCRCHPSSGKCLPFFDQSCYRQIYDHAISFSRRRRRRRRRRQHRQYRKLSTLEVLVKLSRQMLSSSSRARARAHSIF